MVVIITSGFPFKGEPFLLSEKEYMPQNSVFFALSPSQKALNETKYTAFKIPKRKINLCSLAYAFLGLFSPVCYSELKSLIKNKNFNFRNLMRMYAVYGYGMYCYKFIIKELTHILKKDDNVIFYSYWMSTHAFICANLKRKYKKSKFVTRCHGYDLYEYRSKTGYLAFRKFIFNEADKIFPISKNGEEYIHDTYTMYKDLLKNKVETMYLGTMDYGYDIEPSKVNFQIVSCSNLVELKRVNLIIEALSRMQGNIQWTHFGDGKCAESLKRMANEMLGNNIDYTFRGAISNESLMKEYQSMDINLFLNVSEYEGVPVSIMEAMSFGIPVIATNVGGTSEIVQDQYNGKLLNKDFSIEELCESISYFININDSTMRNYRKNARNTWKSFFSAEKNYCKFYREVCE